MCFHWCVSTDPSQPLSEAPPLSVNLLFLSRLLHVVGHVAQQQMIHIEVSISAELKRRKMMEEEEGERRGMGQGNCVPGDHSKTPTAAMSKRRPASAKKVRCCGLLEEI